MSSENILTANILDILFHNRNKEYGAYVLRKNYPKHLYISLAIVFGIVSILSALSFIDPLPTVPDSRIFGTDSVVLVSVEPLKMVEPVKQSVDLPKRVIKDATPVISSTVTTTEVPEVSELDHQVIDLFNRKGEETVGDGPVSASTSDRKVDVEGTPEPASEIKDEVLISADVMPEFPGGIEAMKRFLSRNLRNPEDEMNPGSSVRLVARFVVDKDGSISQVQFKEGGGSKFEQEIMRVLKKMPKWRPGLFKGRPAAVYFMLPVVFQMTEG